METIAGYIDYIKFRNDQNGYTVFNLVVCGEDVTCVGIFHQIEVGMSIEAQGEYSFHRSHGEQFEVKSYHEVPPDDKLSMERYLGSGAIKGIGEALAKRIIKAFGEQTFDIIEKEPERLSEVKGISLRMAQEIGIQMQEKKDAKDAFLFLQQFQISNTMAIKIYDYYGPLIYTVLKENPYKLAENIHGIGFKQADEIAKKMGYQINSEYRIQSAVLYVLQQASLDGHMYLPKSILENRTKELLQLPMDAISTAIENLAMDRKVMIKTVEDCEQVYNSTYYYAELNCARMLHQLNVELGKELLPSEKTLLQKRIHKVETDLSISLDELQYQAVEACSENGVFILSGGPGTGKTTTINAIIEFFLAEGLDLLLCAPTGRAAKRMAEATGYEAKTIHRLLELNGQAIAEGQTAKFERNEENPLEADVVIVDEMSMVDIFLFQSLLKAIIPGTRLILVGDVNQLPSVGPGRVLADLMESKQIPSVILEKIFRQAEESDIVKNAHRILKGETLKLDNQSKDFFFLPRADVNVIYKHLVQLITEKLPPYVKATPQEIQVLTPMKKGPLGVEALNKILQTYVNPKDPAKAEYEAGETLYREGDKIMQMKNNYQLEWEILGNYQIPIDTGTGIFNGDIGTILKIDHRNRVVTVEFDDHKRVEYTYSQLEEIELAYAVTIHKSQGSEYPAVIMPLMSGPQMLMNRNLLYTGITRAKNCVTILGNEQMVMQMAQNTNQTKRYTGLKSRILELSSEN